MDGDRFDELARRTARSRRSLLVALAAVGADVLPPLGLGSASKPNKKKKEKKHCGKRLCPHSCCKAPRGPCGSGTTKEECGFGGEPCKQCTGTTECREPEFGACCQMPGGDCSATHCCYERSGMTACENGKCCIRDGWACESSRQCCEPNLCIGGICTTCFGQLCPATDGGELCCASGFCGFDPGTCCPNGEACAGFPDNCCPFPGCCT